MCSSSLSKGDYITNLSRNESMDILRNTFFLSKSTRKKKRLTNAIHHKIGISFATFFVHIPKKEGVEDIKDFRLIWEHL